MLHTVGRAAGEGVHQTVAEEVAEFTHTEVLLQSRENAVVECVADAGHADALTCIGEGFRARHCQDVFVGVACHGGLIGGFEGVTQVSAEIHGEVGQVFENDAVVLVGQTGDAFQFLFVEAYPRGVVGVRIDDAADIACR